MSRLRIALVGAGSMARNHARVIVRSSRASLTLVVDRDADRAALVARTAGAMATTDLGRAHECDAAIVATASSAHADISLELLEARLPVLVEKPLTLALPETRRLVATAANLDVALMCGLVERFNPALAGLGTAQLSGRSHVRTLRIGPAPRRAHSSVVDDVLLHDLDLVLRVAGDNSVVDVQAAAPDWNLRDGWPDTVTCRLTFANGMTAELHASRVATTKVRAIVITEDGADPVHIDLLEPPGDPLEAQFVHFVDLVRHGTVAKRTAERQSLLPAHELADRVNGLLTEVECVG
jgi:predicted dehydrogenase